ncbi:MAG: hypothetical protein J6P60_01425 [Lachnospiraceae bacterium]|nr:hypothetical protein [Lachnospiraceae bacterium]
MKDITARQPFVYMLWAKAQAFLIDEPETFQITGQRKRLGKQFRLQSLKQKLQKDTDGDMSEKHMKKKRERSAAPG